MSKFQYRSIMSVGWLAVLMSTDNAYAAAVCLVSVGAYSVGALLACRG